MITTPNMTIYPAASIKTIIGTIALSGGLLALPALADTALYFDSSDNSSQPDAIYVRDGQVRIDSTDSSEWMMYDRNKRAMFVVDVDKQQYTLMDEAQMASLGGQLESAMSEFESMLAELPPEQRAAAKAMLDGTLGGAKQQTTGSSYETRKTGKSDRVAGIRCDVMETWSEGEQDMELCIAEPGALNLSNAEQQTLTSMGEFFGNLMSTVEDSMQGLMPVDFGSDSFTEMLEHGLPVRIIDSENNDTAQLKSVSHDSLSNDLFSIPAGYSQASMME